MTAIPGLKNLNKNGSNKAAVFNPTKTRDIVFPISIAPMKFEGLDIKNANQDPNNPPLFDSISTCNLLALKYANSIPEKKADKINAVISCKTSIIMLYLGYLF